MEIGHRVARTMRKSFPWAKTYITPQFQFHFSIAKPAQNFQAQMDLCLSKQEIYSPYIKRFLTLPLRYRPVLRIVCELAPGKDLKHLATGAKLGSRVWFFHRPVTQSGSIGYTEERTEARFKFKLTAESEADPWKKMEVLDETRWRNFFKLWFRCLALPTWYAKDVGRTKNIKWTSHQLWLIPMFNMRIWNTVLPISRWG